MAKFIQISCVRVLNIEGIGLGSSGFLELEKEIPETETVELACINIRLAIEIDSFASAMDRPLELTNHFLL